MHPLVYWTVVLVAGGTAGITTGLMNIFRATSTDILGGLPNPIFSTVELVAAAGLSRLALSLPLGAGLG
ncbi:MAG TPA: DUF4126 domain-containing protein [Coleofasciculaceae cyanobacterium]